MRGDITPLLQTFRRYEKLESSSTKEYSLTFTDNTLHMMAATPPPIRRLVMIGACYVDTILSVSTFPHEDDKLRSTTLTRRRGGNVANTLEVLQQFSQPHLAEIILLCVLPSSTSPGTKFIHNSFGPRINTNHCIYREEHHEPASSYIIKAENTGSRTIVNYNVLPEMTVEEFQTQVRVILAGDDDGKGRDSRVGRTWFHFEGRETETATACLQWLKCECSGSILSVEVEKPKRPGLEQMAGLADTVFFSKAWAEAEGYTSAEELLRAQGRRLPSAKYLCCTWGADGAAVWRPDFFLHRRPAKSVIRVVDAIGAGDTFLAGMLHQFLHGVDGNSRHEDVVEALKFAVVLAGRKVQQEGFEGLETFMRFSHLHE